MSELWTRQDVLNELCQPEDLGMPKPKPVEVDPLESDLELARQLYRKNPIGFINNHPSVANKLLDLQEKRAGATFPAFEDRQGWNLLIQKLAKEATGKNILELSTPVILLVALANCNFDLGLLRIQLSDINLD